MKYIKMPKELAEKWLADLRGGEYQQCRGKMTNGTGFCCLGVLQKGISGEITTSRNSELPSMEWLHSRDIEFFGEDGVFTNDPYNPKMDETYSVLNDTSLSFREIADLLESEIEYNDK